MARIVCLGELLLRLGAPRREFLLQSPVLDVHVGGAEANVAVSLARFGHDTAMISGAPDNALGEAAVGELRRHGVDTRHVRRLPGRMGLYFLATGAGHRPSEVLYDRADSAFALSTHDQYDFAAALQGADLFHVSGVTPALGANGASIAQAAVQAARAAGVRVSFDGNFRPKLWAAWDGDPRTILHDLLAHADIAFADHRDIDVILGDSAQAPADSHEARVIAAAARAFAAFPCLQRITSTIRSQHSVDHHALGAIMVTRAGDVHRIEDRELPSIVDRIGGGDAFAAGVLHGLASGFDDAGSLRFGLAAACLKHAVPGDFNLVGTDDVSALMREERLDVKR
jgi:2-dehydro-3-deoxygluconokinase